MTIQHFEKADRHGGVGIDQQRSGALRGVRFARRLVAVGLGVAMTLPIAAPAASFAASKPPAATCSQLTKAQVQPLLSSHITAIRVANYRVLTATGYANGQRCNVAISDESAALTVVVLEGHVNDLVKGDEVSNHGSIKVPGIGMLAFRATGDGSDQVSSAKGNLYCSVVTGDPGNVPGIAQREEAAGNTSDIGDKVYGAISAALGTLCNRIYRSGNTTPNLHFPPSPMPTTTTFPTGLNVQK